MKASFREFLSESNTPRIITLNDYSDVTKDVKDRIISNDLDILQINYNCDDDSLSPFCNMRDLTEIKFQIKLGANVKSLFGFFYNCKTLKTVPLFNTEKVTNMEAMFEYCSALVDVPLFNTAKVTNMSNMFDNCKSLRAVPKFDTSKVTNMSNMFAHCKALKDVPKFDTSKVSNMNYMFFDCPAEERWKYY